MRTSREVSKKKNGSLVKLKIVVKMLQKSLILGKKSSPEMGEMAVPEDVKEGHFAVIAVEEEKVKRFVVPLTFLTHPSFLRLLEQAEEEYGFDHEGALTVPCWPSKLEGILAAAGGGGGDRWTSYSKTMVKSC